MATGGNEGGDFHGLDQTKKARNLRELFRGRLTDTEAETLLRLFDGNLGRTVGYILNARSGELSELLDSNGIENRVSVVTEDNVLRDLARKNEIGKSIRQFACKDCDKAWWRRVPNRKMVSRCFSCRRKFDALSRDNEWGSAEYECECGNTFTGWGYMGRTQRECYQCQEMCYPAKILPPLRASGILVLREGSREGSHRGRRRGRHYDRRGGPQGAQRNEDSGPGMFSHLNDQLHVSASFELEANTHLNNQPTTRRRVLSDRRGGPQGAQRNEESGPGMFSHPNEQLHVSASFELDANTHLNNQLTTRRRVLSASQLHISSGSTVNTFLDQDDIDKPEYEPSLSSILEVSD